MQGFFVALAKKSSKLVPCPAEIRESPQDFRGAGFDAAAVRRDHQTSTDVPIAEGNAKIPTRKRSSGPSPLGSCAVERNLTIAAVNRFVIRVWPCPSCAGRQVEWLSPMRAASLDWCCLFARSAARPRRRRYRRVQAAGTDQDMLHLQQHLIRRLHVRREDGLHPEGNAQLPSYPFVLGKSIYWHGRPEPGNQARTCSAGGKDDDRRNSSRPSGMVRGIRDNLRIRRRERRQWFGDPWGRSQPSVSRRCGPSWRQPVRIAPGDVSLDSITASVLSQMALATSLTSARVGDDARSSIPAFGSR